MAQMTDHGIFVVCIHSWTLRPGSASITRYGDPSASVPKSRARTIAGWSSAATARASCWNHQLSSGRVGPLASSGERRRFSATRSPVTRSRQRYDDPHAAAPELADDLVPEREDRANLARRGGLRGARAGTARRAGRLGGRRVRTPLVVLLCLRHRGEA